MKIQILSPLSAVGRHFCKGFVCSHQWDSCCQPGQVCWNYKMRTTNWTLNKNIKGIWSLKESQIKNMHNPYWDLPSQIKNIQHIRSNIAGLSLSSSSGQKETFITTKTVLYKLPDNLWWIIVLEILFNMRMLWWLRPFPLFKKKKQPSVYLHKKSTYSNLLFLP